ncbi:MAG: DUF4153 domain-containing protein [Bdellovibrionales bacterium]|nr:DUF4153 domain-containing protein [Bdellovibrionales bacterium]
MRFIQNLPSIKFLADEAKNTFLRFPFTIIVAILATSYSIYAVEWDIRLDDAKLALTLALGIPLFFAMTLLRESKGWTSFRHKSIEFGIGTIFLTLHYFFTANDGTNNYYLKYLHISLGLHLLVAFIAFTHKRDKNEFWQFNRYLFLRIVLSVLYSGVFFCGLAIALVTFSKLFLFNISHNRYFELWLISAFVLTTWHFLAGVPKLVELKEDTSYPKGLRFFVQFLLIPLVSLYMVILYCYMTKILITWNWPNGYIGWLVSIMSVLGIFNLLLIDPEKQKAENRWISSYSKYYYILILPLLGMFFMAIGKRVSEYGVTEQRYFLIILGSLLTGLAAYFIFSAKKNIKVIPISFFAVVVLSLWGPWSAYNYSLRNQKSRAQKILEKYRLLVGNTTKVATVSVNSADERQLSSIFDYIIQNHGSDAISEWFPKSTLIALGRSNDAITVQKPRSQNAQALMEHLGLKYKDKWNLEQKSSFNFRSDLTIAPFSVAGFNNAVLVNFNTYGNENWKSVSLKGKDFSIGVEKSTSSFVIRENSKNVITLPMADLIKKLRAAQRTENPNNDLLTSHDQLTVEGGNDFVKVKLLIKDMIGEYNEDMPSINNLNGIILLK